MHHFLVRYRDHSVRTWPIVAAVLIVAVTATVPVWAQPEVSFVVNDLGDESDTNPGDGQALTAGGVTTLRAAIQEVQALGLCGEITFESALFTTPATIALTAPIETTACVTIIGPGMDLLTIDAANQFRVFKFTDATVNLEGLTLTRGKVTLSSGLQGGGIYCGDSSLIMRRCSVTSCYGLYTGGAIYADNSGIVDVAECVFRGNIAGTGFRMGGAIHCRGDGLDTTISDTLFENNRADDTGSAVYIEMQGDIAIHRSIFRNNVGSSPVSFGNKSAVIMDSSIYENNATDDIGGALTSSADYVLARNCTFSGNEAAYGGGGVYVGVGTTTIVNCTIVGNSSGDDNLGYGGGGVSVSSFGMLELGNTIIAGNVDGLDLGPDVVGTVVSLGGNLIGNGRGSVGYSIAEDQVGTDEQPIDPVLGALGFHGGPTFTMLPLEESPAIDMGKNVLITTEWFDDPAYDQRGVGYPRIREDVVDVGAVETGPDVIPPVIILLGASPLPYECGSAYVDPGVTAIDDIDGDLSPSVQITGTVDSETPGEYVLTYDVSDAAGNAAISVERTVIVSDTTPPVITLIGEAILDLECHTTYNDLGATADEACDTALPAVTVDSSALDPDTVGDYEVIYTLSDNSGNAAEAVVRTVQVRDTTAPVITLLGEATVTLPCGEPYVELGATAGDACDTALPAVAADSSGVDVNTAGSYEVTYTVSDAAGNAANPVVRTVVVEGPCIPAIHTADQDGDHKINLTELLRIIQFFNSGGFHCADDPESTEDGFAPAPGANTSCLPHSSDYFPSGPDWQIALTELLRIIQFFNSGGYHLCLDADPPTEDGYCPGP